MDLAAMPITYWARLSKRYPDARKGTHFWFRPQELDCRLFEEWGRECRAIITDHRSQIPSIALCGPAGMGEPILTDALVAFNGDAALGLAGEQFEIRRSRSPRFRDVYDHQACVLELCRVNGHPYGRVVAACLAALERRFGELVHAHVDWPGCPIVARHRWLAPVIEATDETYPQLVGSPGYTLIVYDIASAIYRNDRRLRSAVRRAAKQYQGRLAVVVFDHAMCPNTKPQFRTTYTPGLFLHCDGKLIDGEALYQREEDVLDLISPYVRGADGHREE